MFRPRAHNEYWFRMGRLEVTSTLLLVFIGLIGMIVSAIAPPLFAAAFLTTDSILAGQVWRLFTWPLANQVSLWTLIAFAMLWYFGTSIEVGLGKKKMLQLYLEVWLALTASTFVVGLLFPGSTAMAGMGQIEFLILLLWIAEYPTRRFFFAIPAWALGAFFVALSILQLMAAGRWGGILAMLLSFLLVAMAARRLGLLHAYEWLPGGRPKKASKRSSRRKRRAKNTNATMGGKPASRQQRRQQSDEQRLDELLGKISSEGIHSLTKKERADLEPPLKECVIAHWSSDSAPTM